MKIYISVNKDLANETLEKRKEQVDKFKEAKRAGKTAYFTLDRLYINDRRKIVSSEVILDIRNSLSFQPYFPTLPCSRFARP